MNCSKNKTCNSCMNSRCETQPAAPLSPALICVALLLPLLFAAAGAAVFSRSINTQAAGAFGGLLTGFGLARLLTRFLHSRKDPS